MEPERRRPPGLSAGGTSDECSFHPFPAVRKGLLILEAAPYGFLKPCERDRWIAAAPAEAEPDGYDHLCLAGSNKQQRPRPTAFIRFVG